MHLLRELGSTSRCSVGSERPGVLSSFALKTTLNLKPQTLNTLNTLNPIDWP